MSVQASERSTLEAMTCRKEETVWSETILPTSDAVVP